MEPHQDEGRQANKDYVDHADDPAPTIDHYENLARRGNLIVFPLKLYNMLQRVEENGEADIVSWQPHGRCFVIHKPKEFKDILPKYFKLTKASSFHRQINLYGFKRLWQLGPDRGGYYHPCFLRGKAFLIKNIDRVTVKGTGVRSRANPDDEPYFNAMKPVMSPSQALPSRSDREVPDQRELEPGLATLDQEVSSEFTSSQECERKCGPASSPCSVRLADFEAEWAATASNQQESFIEPLPFDTEVDPNLLLEFVEILAFLLPQEIKDSMQLEEVGDYPRPVAPNGMYQLGGSAVKQIGSRWCWGNFYMPAAA